MEQEKQSIKEPQSEHRNVNWFKALLLISGIGLLLIFVGSVIQKRFGKQQGFVLPSLLDITPVTVSGLNSASSELRSQESEGDSAPDFTLRTLEGDLVSLSDFRGRPVIINFWATWCGPCRLEMPELVRVYHDNLDEGFVILAVNVTYQDSIDDVTDFVQEFEIDFPVLLDDTGEVSEDLYQLFGLPMSVFIDREGIIRRTHIGIMTAEQVTEFSSELINN